MAVSFTRPGTPKGPAPISSRIAADDGIVAPPHSLG
jgi:hypothetical protein